MGVEIIGPVPDEVFPGKITRSGNMRYLKNLVNFES